MATQDSWGSAPFTIVSQDGDVCQIWVKGRDRWALESLILAGDAGCTPIDNPAPRWSAYAFNLRQVGVNIETIHEPHGGPFSGTHGRYVLRCTVFQGLKGAND